MYGARPRSLLRDQTAGLTAAVPPDRAIARSASARLASPVPCTERESGTALLRATGGERGVRTGDEVRSGRKRKPSRGRYRVAADGAGTLGLEQMGMHVLHALGFPDILRDLGATEGMLAAVAGDLIASLAGGGSRGASGHWLRQESARGTHRPALRQPCTDKPARCCGNGAQRSRRACSSKCDRGFPPATRCAANKRAMCDDGAKRLRRPSLSCATAMASSAAR